MFRESKIKILEFLKNNLNKDIEKGLIFKMKIRDNTSYAIYFEVLHIRYDTAYCWSYNSNAIEEFEIDTIKKWKYETLEKRGFCDFEIIGNLDISVLQSYIIGELEKLNGICGEEKNKYSFYINENEMIFSDNKNSLITIPLIPLHLFQEHEEEKVLNILEILEKEKVLKNI